MIALAGEFDLLTALHALVDVHLQHLPLRDGLLAMASLAPVLGVHHLAGTLTLVTGLLYLLHHRTQLSKGDLDTLTTAAGAGLHGALLAASTFTAFADDRFR